MLGINSDPVTIKQVEVEIVDRAWDEGWIAPQVAERLSGKTVGVVGSGPAGLAAAQQLTRAGHTVVVYERADRIGGLLRYGIPEFKMEKRHLELRLLQMEEEGTRFRAGVNVGVDITAEQLRKRHDAIVLAGGSTVPRDLDVPGRELTGIYPAMDYLPLANRVQQGDIDAPPISAGGQGRHHPRRWRHRRGLPRYVAAAGRAFGDPAGDPGAAAGRSHRHDAVADVPDDLPGLERARRGRRPGLRGVDAALHRRCRRHGSAAWSSPRSTRSSSRSRAPSRSCPPSWCCSRWASSARSRARCSTDLEVGLRPARQRRSRRRVDDRRRRASSSAATWAAASRSSCGRSPRAARAPSAVDRWLMGDTQLPRPIAPTDRPIA